MTAPTERPTLRRVAPAPLLTALLAALAVAGAVARVRESERVPVAVGAGAGAVLLVVAVAVAAHAVQTARLTRRRLEALTADTGRLLQDRIRQSAEFDQERVRLTEELTRERARVAADIAQERARLAAEFTHDRARLAAENERLAEQAHRAEHDRAAALAATANAASRMQALATSTLADLRAMEERHSDEDVLADLLHLDHRTAQAGRLADSVAVLAGARSGRRWARPIAMESILRGAMGRISGYQRVRVHSASEAAVAGHAAEGVMHALAELLDNAANFSPPTAEVHVYVEEVPAGVIVSVEDSGLVMSEVQLRRAEKAVSGDTEGLGGLSGTRLGLAVVGRLSRKHGLKISYRPSARGGTGVLLLVPQDILHAPANNLTEPTETSPQPHPGMPADGKPWPSTSEPHQPTAEPDPAPTRTRDTTFPDGLPRRRRGQALAKAERDGARATAPDPAAPVPLDDPLTRAARFSSFRRAVRGSLSDLGGTDDEPAAADAQEQVVAVRRSPPLTRPGSPEPDQQASNPSAAGSPYRHDPDPRRTPGARETPTHPHPHPHSAPHDQPSNAKGSPTS
ncbi:ATP-binding protein [Streptomyces sp. NPDC005799]|uniref:sensor histidine kinase n=1 Tax=Streptomyces sp. NPDC005799 TaxID=3154678 RepID=UPI003406896F